MRFKTLFAVCALFGSLFQSSPSLSETLRTAWLGEHEAFLTWYAKEKGWTRKPDWDIIMLRFDSGKSLIENVRAYDWAIAGCGAVPAMQATMSDQVEVIAIANDESSANMILTRPDSPILAEKGFNPDFPNVFGTPESVKGKLILCPKKRRPAICSTNGSPRSGLRRRDVKDRGTGTDTRPRRVQERVRRYPRRLVAVHPRSRNARVQNCGAFAGLRCNAARTPCRGSRVHGKESGRRACVFESLPAGCG